MKKIFTVVCLLICVNMYAQKCSDYLFLQNNKTVEMTIYNKKGEENGKQIYTVSNVTNTGDVTTATLKSEMFDKKGKSIVKASNHIKCVSGVMMMNMKMMLPQQQAEQFGKAEATAEDVYIDYPSTMNAGDQLKDGSFSMDIDNNGLKQTINMSVTNRKVEGKESVTTTAGTWDCFKDIISGSCNTRYRYNINSRHIGSKKIYNCFSIIIGDYISIPVNSCTLIRKLRVLYFFIVIIGHIKRLGYMEALRNYCFYSIG